MSGSSETTRGTGTGSGSRGASHGISCDLPSHLRLDHGRGAASRSTHRPSTSVRGLSQPSSKSSSPVTVATFRHAMAIDAVIFDWGGTLTRWHDVDFHAESLALAAAVVDHDRPRRRTLSRAALHAAGSVDLGPLAATTSRARRSPTSSTRPGSTTTRPC